ncbi:MAG: 16S rRNA (guanine(966)-N(2))-methyltransferase RsmD [Azovibrio sp.]|uniref:16S rRNA (guanine(966)-N(2))-methyltransferase RsmD n=1 Tax=Azovibrio sp. TaxID=1872673 RepID=UPI003C783163
MNQVRIIGGQWRRQVLRFPDSEALRPTPDRVRETLFNWLGQDLSGQTCLDLFAGSGALGFEAASRGAEKVVLVEQAPRVLAALKDNAQRLQCGNTVEIVGGDALKFAASCRQPFDVLFADPPYKQGWLARLEPLLPGLLAGDGALYLEAEAPVVALGAWKTVRQGRAGQVYFHLLRQESNA